MTDFKSEGEARKKAEEALSLLNNKEGWTIRTWNNLGWHWSLQCGAMSLNSTNQDEFYVLLSDDVKRPYGGEVFWTTHSYDKDPNKVIAQQLELARAFIAKCQAAIDSVSV